MNCGLIATYIGTSVSVISAGCSAFAWVRTKTYCKRIIIVEDIEKIDICINEIDKCLKKYRQILSILGNDRGSDGEEGIKKKFITLKGYLHNIEKELPHKYKKNLKLEEPVRYIDNVIGGKFRCKYGDDFSKLQSQFNDILGQLKDKRDELRGTK